MKDPMFYAESLYLKSPKRIMALLMVMGLSLSLLVYALAERKLRKHLKSRARLLKTRRESLTTIRLSAGCFRFNVLLFTYEDGQRTENMLMNMDDDNYAVIKCLGPPFEKICFLD